MPGYLPEMTPETFDSPSEAMAFLADELDRIADHAYDLSANDDVDKVDALIATLRDGEIANQGSLHLEPTAVIPSGLVFWWDYDEEYGA